MAQEQLASFPVYLRLAGRPVLVAGGGRVAARRVNRLLAAGARITVVAPVVDTAIAEWAEQARLVWHGRRVDVADIEHKTLIFAATDDATVNAELVAAARARGIPVQRADAAEESDFFVPAMVTRGALQIAVSSGGAAPTLARRLRAQLETWIPPAYGDLAALAARFRRPVREQLPQTARAAFWQQIFDGPIAEKVFAGRADEAAGDLEASLDNARRGASPTLGEVFLVGAGPGDPDLLTFRALRLMQRADVVLYDSLVPSAIVDLVPREAERIHVGKRAARHTLPQPDINGLMVRLARAGRRVLRLKGGDPFVFGRGGEEIAELAAAGISFQIVPGIIAATGCAAYAGIPLTHRDYAQSVIFVTGHRQQGRLDLAWPELARAGQTVVFFMARKTLNTICDALQSHGLPADWPAAMVIDGTTPRQQLIVGTLANLPARMTRVQVGGPALLIVGEVVRLNETLGWFRPPVDIEPANARR